MMKPLVIAHRGASAYAPENTLPAFALAVQQGADMLELDVRCTADQHLVVIHNAAIEDKQGKPCPIHTLTLHDLRLLYPPDAPIPTFAEVCQFAQAQHIALNVEIKEPATVVAVVALLRQYRLTETTLVSSFHATALQTLLAVAPELQRGYLMGTRTLRPHIRLRELFPRPHLRHVQATAWHPSVHMVGLRWLVPLVRRWGYAVYVWTVDNPSVMQNLVSLGATGFITNVPDVARTALSYITTNA